MTKIRNGWEFRRAQNILGTNRPWHPGETYHAPPLTYTMAYLTIWRRSVVIRTLRKRRTNALLPGWRQNHTPLRSRLSSVGSWIILAALHGQLQLEDCAHSDHVGLGIRPAWDAGKLWSTQPSIPSLPADPFGERAFLGHIFILRIVFPSARHLGSYCSSPGPKHSSSNLEDSYTLYVAKWTLYPKDHHDPRIKNGYFNTVAEKKAISTAIPWLDRTST